MAPPVDSGDGLIVFGPGATSAQAFNAIGRIGGKVVGADSAGAVWAVKLDTPNDDARARYRSGALLVRHSSALALGCLSWFRPPGAVKT